MFNNNLSDYSAKCKVVMPETEQPLIILKNVLLKSSLMTLSSNSFSALPKTDQNIELAHMCKLRRSQSSLHTARRCIPNVPTYISNDHEHQNGTINSSLMGVVIGDWKFYNHQGLCFNSKCSIRVGLMDITCGLMISQDRNLDIRDFYVQ
ncbi:hypothetical protein H8356DRAFT_1339595 [Neocallimastix lanati (nom. inval.)]|nr:hypothetical protein H8356DRAFT_1339595 [Neocallimastix sp. JGI-2020a]